MPYWTEKIDDKISTVSTFFDDVQMKIGAIEKPYYNEEKYFCTGWNHETLGNNGSFIFRDFDEAERRIISHYEGEMNILNDK